MARYSVSNNLGGTMQAMGSSYKTLLALTCQTSPLGRFKIYEWKAGTVGAPADNYIEYDISRQVSAGTATSVTANPLDSADAPASTVCVANATAEGTITAASSIDYWPVNQRASVRWAAAGDEDMLVAPAVNNAGFAFRAKSSVSGYAGLIGVSIRFKE
ncbi:MAG: hypothetical protein ACREC4_00390 [Methylocella sp.]